MRSLDDILLEKREALKEIRDITKKQPTCIADDDTDELLNCISERQRFIDVVDMLDKEAQSAQEDGSGLAAQMREEIRAILLEVQEQDVQNEAMATAKLDYYREQIRLNNESSRSVGAYAGHLEGGRPSSYDVKK